MFRIIFAGTPEFAVPSLDALVKIGLKPSHVITQPDRKSGRGKKISKSVFLDTGRSGRRGADSV